jgi:hypothetical protein
VEVLNELDSRLACVEGRMVVTSELLAGAREQNNLGHAETYRAELFEHQMQAASLRIQAEEQQDHVANVRKRLGEEPTSMELDRAKAVIEMHEKLASQLVEMARLYNWFDRRKKADAAA